MNESTHTQTSRRQFIKTSTAAALAFPAVLSAAPNSEKLRIGLVGCGGRGTGAVAQAFNADSNVELTAMGDMFEEKLKESLGILRKQSPDRVKVEPQRCFIGFDAYEKV